MPSLVWGRNLCWQDLQRLDKPSDHLVQYMQSVISSRRQWGGEVQSYSMPHGFPSNFVSIIHQNPNSSSDLGYCDIRASLEAGELFYLCGFGLKPVSPLLRWKVTDASEKTSATFGRNGQWQMTDHVNGRLGAALRHHMLYLKPPVATIASVAKSKTSQTAAAASQATREWSVRLQLKNRKGGYIAGMDYLIEYEDDRQESGVSGDDGTTTIIRSGTKRQKIRLSLPAEDVKHQGKVTKKDEKEFVHIKEVQTYPDADKKVLLIQISVQEEIEIADILYETGSNKLFLLTPEDVAEIEAEEKLLDDISQRLQQAQGPEEHKAIIEEMVDIGVMNTKPVSAPAKLTEIRRLLGHRYYTYVRSAKMKNHWRSYSMEATDRDARVGWMDSSLSGKERAEKLYESIKEQSKLKVKLTADLGSCELPDDNPFYQIMNTYADGYNGKPMYSGNDENDSHFIASRDAQWMRFAAGASSAAEIDLTSKNINIHGKAEASFTLLSGSCSVKGVWPANNDSEIIVPYTVKENGVPVRKEISLGHFQAEAEIGLSGFAGATAVLSAAVNVDCSSGRPTLRGHTGKDDPNSAELKGDVFVGVKAGGNMTGRLKWVASLKNNDDWKELCVIGKKVEIAAGLSLSGEFTIRYHQPTGAFILRCHAGLVMGVGASGEFALEFNMNNIMAMFDYIYLALKKADFHKLEFIDGEDFGFYCLYVIFRILDMPFSQGIRHAKKGYDYVEDVISNFFTESDSERKAEELASKIIADIDLGVVESYFMHAPPEVKGVVLNTLVYDDWWTFWNDDTKQRAAITKIFGSFQSWRDYYESVCRMTPNGDKSDYGKNASRLYQFWAGENSEDKQADMERHFQNIAIEPDGKITYTLIAMDYLEGARVPPEGPFPMF